MMKTARDERLLCKQTDWKKNNLEKCYCLFSKGVLVRTGFPLVLIEIIDRPGLAYNKEVNYPDNSSALFRFGESRRRVFAE
jgi:hypothetical protein